MMPGDQEIEGDSDVIDVRTHREFFTRELLRGGKGGSAEERAGGGDSRLGAHQG